jgi:threonyl-tRNA synthetase
MGSTMISILKIKITEADFKKIEDSILEISRGKHELRPVSKADALELYKDNVYKTEMITNLEDGTITFCDHDTFTDLCRGGHIEYRYYQSSKIMSVAELTGVVMKKQTTNTCLWNFISKTKDLTEYLLLLEEAKRRDHRN